MFFNKVKVYFLFTAFLCASCAEDTSDKRAEYDQVFHEVLEVHDEVMPKMGDISSLSQQLSKIADTTSTPETYLNAKKKLTVADSLMMTWMRSFSDEFVRNKAKVKTMSNQELEEQINALKDEREEVEEVKEAINSSIENARDLIQQ